MDHCHIASNLATTTTERGIADAVISVGNACLEAPICSARATAAAVPAFCQIDWRCSVHAGLCSSLGRESALQRHKLLRNLGPVLGWAIRIGRLNIIAACTDEKQFCWRQR